MNPTELPCEDCGAQPGQPCNVPLAGVDTSGWNHDSRILAAMFASPTVGTPERGCR